MTQTNLPDSLKRLEFLIETIPAKLSEIKDEEFNRKPAPAKWSKKEIVGHLIDSAANNHQRFIRAQYENVPVIFYDQDKWNELNHYRQADSAHVINFWKIYNQHLLNVTKNIPAENLRRECNTGDEKNVTIEWLIIDYVKHMEHHLKQIITL